MNLEIFSHSKYKNQLLDGDDIILHIPDKVYAVFDGATDAKGTKLEGVSVGRVAASTVASEISNLILNVEMDETTPLEIVLERLKNSLKNKFCQLGEGVFPSTTASMLFEFEDCYRLIVIGDSSIRINGTTAYSQKKLIDKVATHARVWVFNYLKNKLKKEKDEIEILAKRVIFMGIDLAIKEAVLTRENAKEIVKIATELSGIVESENDVDEFLRAGIQSQYKYANNSSSILGYGCLDSTNFLLKDAIDLCLPKTEIKMIEVYSDGYLSEPQNSANIESWESEFNRVENLGFHKIGKFPSVKGSTQDQFSDDRSIMILSE